GCKKFNSVSSTAGRMSKSVLPAPVVVSKEDRPIPDLARMKPEGASVTIALPVVNPGAGAAEVAEPLLARPGTEYSGLTRRPARMVSFSVGDPVTSAVPDRSTRCGSELTRVISNPQGGAASSSEILAMS